MHRGPVAGQVPGGDRRRHRLRLAGWGHPPGIRPADGLDEGAPHPRPPRAGRGARRRGVCRRHRSRGRVHGDLWAGCDQPRHPHRRCLHGLGADRRDHRPGAQRLDRHGRLPGGGHPRHHHADHQAQLPGDQPGRHPASHRRGVPHRWHRPSRSGPGRHQQGRPGRPDDLRLAANGRSAGLSSGRPSA